MTAINYYQKIERSFWLRNLGVTATIFLGTWLSHISEFEMDGVPVVWVVGAFNLLFMIRYGLAVAPACILGYELYHWFFIDPYPPMLVPMSIANTLSCWLGASLFNSFTVRQGSRTHILKEVQSLFVFVLLAALIMSISSAVLGNAVLIYSGALDIKDLGLNLMRWIISDFVGVILLGPALLLIGKRTLSTHWLDWIKIFTAVAATLCAVNLLYKSIDIDYFSTLWLLIPVSMWLALRRRAKELSIAIAVLNLGWLSLTLKHFAHLDEAEILLIPLYSAFIMILTLVLHAASREAPYRRAQSNIASRALSHGVSDRVHTLSEAKEALFQLERRCEQLETIDIPSSALNYREFDYRLLSVFDASADDQPALALVGIKMIALRDLMANEGPKKADSFVKSLVSGLNVELPSKQCAIARLSTDYLVCFLPEQTLDQAKALVSRAASIGKVTGGAMPNSELAALRMGVAVTNGDQDTPSQLMARLEQDLEQPSNTSQSVTSPSKVMTP